MSDQMKTLDHRRLALLRLRSFLPSEGIHIKIITAWNVLRVDITSYAAVVGSTKDILICIASH